MPEALLTVEEFANRTHQHAQTVRRQIRRGAVPTVRTGRKYLIPESALEARNPIDTPPTPAEIARRLAALDSIKHGAISRATDAPAVDLEADPWGHRERAEALHPAPFAQGDTPEARAGAILAALESGDKERRNAAIIQLARSDEQTVEIVTEAAARAVEAWDGPEDDLSDWRALDGEPFHFPEESPDYLKGLYRADKAEKENA